MDKYSDFKSLAASEMAEQDYRIRIQDIGSHVTVIAPHGGRIEPKTSFIAKQVAGNKYNYYCFEGIKEKNNQDLHITSHRFDEPGAIDLVGASEIVIAIHACKEKDDIIFIGGCFKELISAIRTALEKLNVLVLKHSKLSGTHPENICNKGKGKEGVQLEISRGLRDNVTKLVLISKATQVALSSFHRCPGDNRK